jgi:hypothetical protein
MWDTPALLRRQRNCVDDLGQASAKGETATGTRLLHDMLKGRSSLPMGTLRRCDFLICYIVYIDTWVLTGGLQMVEYAYTTVTGKIKPLLGKIRTVGVPPKATLAWLKTIGFTSSNDSTLLGVLKFVGLTDQSGIPSTRWSAYRGATHRVVLGEAIRHGYADLYAVYPDAHLRSNTDLTHVFSTSSSAGAQVIAKTVATFKALAEEADFPAHAGATDTTMESGPLHTPAATHAPKIPHVPTGGGGPEVHIDIQIHISPESTAAQIDKIFESMAKHLYGRKGDE